MNTSTTPLRYCQFRIQPQEHQSKKPIDVRVDTQQWGGNFYLRALYEITLLNREVEKWQYLSKLNQQISGNE
jgi:hypothetical protein